MGLEVALIEAPEPAFSWLQAVVTGGIGSLITLLGVLFTQWRADKRERAQAELRQQSDHDAYLRERKMNACNAFQQAAHGYRWELIVAAHAPGLHDAKKFVVQQSTFYAAFEGLAFVCPDEVIQAAHDLYERLTDAVKDPEKSMMTQDMEPAYGNWVNAVRADLLLPPRTDRRVDRRASFAQ